MQLLQLALPYANTLSILESHARTLSNLGKCFKMMFWEREALFPLQQSESLTLTKRYQLSEDTMCTSSLIPLVSGIPAIGRDLVTLPGGKVVKEAVLGPQSTCDTFLLRERTCCRRTFTLLYTGAITKRSKTSCTTSVNTFQRQRGPKHLFDRFHFSASLHEVQSPQMQAQTEKEAGCTSGTSLVLAPDRCSSAWPQHHQRSATDQRLHCSGRSTSTDLPSGTCHQLQPWRGK